MLRAGDALVAARTQLIDTTRGLVKSVGARLPKCSSPSFPHKAEAALPVEMRESLLPLVRLVEMLSDSIKVYDERIEKLASQKYKHTELLRQVKGVGALTSLAYVLTLENPERFTKSRDVGPYLGLVPKQEDSRESQPQLRISKAEIRDTLRSGSPPINNICNRLRLAALGSHSEGHPPFQNA